MQARIIKPAPSFEQSLSAFLCELVAREQVRKNLLKRQMRRRIEILAVKLERRVIPQNQPQPN